MWRHLARCQNLQQWMVMDLKNIWDSGAKVVSIIFIIITQNLSMGDYDEYNRHYLLVACWLINCHLDCYGYILGLNLDVIF